MGLQLKSLIALSVGACALLWSGNIPLNKATPGVMATSLVSMAEARVARTASTRGRTVNRSRSHRDDWHNTRVYH
jgi:hypothetical protein